MRCIVCIAPGRTHPQQSKAAAITMKTRHLIKTSLLATACAVAMGFATSANGQVVYSQTFNGSNSTAISGTAPTVTPDPDNKWAGGTGFKADGSFASESVYLRLSSLPAGAADTTLAISTTYQATLKLSYTTSALTSWVGIGFSKQNPALDSSFSSVSFNTAASESFAWMLWRGNGQVRVFGGSDVTNEWLANTDYSASMGSNATMRIVLTTGVTLASSSVDMYLGSNQLDLNGAGVGNTRTGVDAAAFTALGISANAASTTLGADLTSLEWAVVPEPTTWALLAGGLAVVTVFRRRRN